MYFKVMNESSSVSLQDKFKNTEIILYLQGYN